MRIPAIRFTPLALIATGLLNATLLSAQQDYQAWPREPLSAQPNNNADRADPRIEKCLIDFLYDVEVPGEESGVLVFLGVKEGDLVEAEQLIAQVDDRDVRQGYRIAQYGKRAADARAEDDIEIVYSRAAAAVAREDWQEMEQAHLRVNKSTTENERRKAKLEYDRSKLAIEKAEKDRILAKLDADTKQAELDAAQIAVDKRRVLAPFTGVVLEVLRDEQEWVQPGEPIVRIAQLDTLKIDGFLYFDEYDPGEIDGCEVTVEVTAGRGRVHEATGRIVHVDPRAQPMGKRYRYRVRAEVANRQVKGRWLLQPKLPTTMTIHLGTGGESQVGDRRAPAK
ncbi:efflux RND transporter periplasmic adaptor subunit [Botrimarina hoheduenensis]|nr:HlyD family efflux transporter periplasmic adaptor subunit [Botrimarina hoheduenensis]